MHSNLAVNSAIRFKSLISLANEETLTKKILKLLAISYNPPPPPPNT